MRPNLGKLEATQWDLIIIGGGATGLGIALDGASRGYKTLLFEQSDFAKATSSRSTKLIHGGLRYLQQGNIKLVKEALRERGLLCKNAPHLVHPLPFLVPSYHWWENPFYSIGLKVYDLLAGKLGIEASRHLSKEEALDAFPTLEPEDLCGGTIYYDAQFDDARLAITLALSAIDHGASLINYAKVTSFLKKNGRCIGVRVEDEETKKRYSFTARAIINATGVFSDQILKKDNVKAKSILAISQGVHLVLERSFLPGSTAVLIPHTEDKRVLFMVPWHDRVLIGTTDTPIHNASLEPEPLHKEVSFLLKTASSYLAKRPKKKDILSVFAGLRPLIKAHEGKATSLLSRDHKIFISASKLITISGGKWTTYRKMAEDVMKEAIRIGELPSKPCVTHKLRLHGWKKTDDVYGSDRKQLDALVRKNKALGSLLHPRLPYQAVDVIFAVRHEMARTVEDVLARRTRALFLDAKASMEAAPQVAQLMATELKKDKKWEKKQVKEYKQVAKRYTAQ